jgi:hypothetical protein
LAQKSSAARAIKVAGMLIWFLILAELSIIGFLMAALVHAVASR